MSGERKIWLKALANRCKAAWMTAVCPEDQDGLTRVETAHTIYSFKDGECIEVIRRTYEPVESAPFLGLKIVGWVTEEHELLRTWRPGARAVLWRAGKPGEEATVAVTSPAFGFRRLAPREDDDEITLMSLRRKIARPRPEPASMTRVLAATPPSTPAVA